MRTTLLAFLAAMTTPCGILVAAPVFSDDFSSPTLDTAKWSGPYWFSGSPDPLGRAGMCIESGALHVKGFGGYNPSVCTKVRGGLPSSYVLEFDYMRPAAESTQGYGIGISCANPSADGVRPGDDHMGVLSTTGQNARKFEALGTYTTGFVMEPDTWYSIRATVVDCTVQDTGYTTWSVYTRGFGSLLGSMTFPTFRAHRGFHHLEGSGICFAAHIDTTSAAGGFFVDNVAVTAEHQLTPAVLDSDDSGMIDQPDRVVLGLAYGAKPGDRNWNRRCDFDGDGTVNSGDRHLLDASFGQSCRFNIEEDADCYYLESEEFRVAVRKSTGMLSSVAYRTFGPRFDILPSARNGMRVVVSNKTANWVAPMNAVNGATAAGAGVTAEGRKYVELTCHVAPQSAEYRSINRRITCGISRAGISRTCTVPTR